MWIDKNLNKFNTLTYLTCSKQAIHSVKHVAVRFDRILWHKLSLLDLEPRLRPKPLAIDHMPPPCKYLKMWYLVFGIRANSKQCEYQIAGLFAIDHMSPVIECECPSIWIRWRSFEYVNIRHAIRTCSSNFAKHDLIRGSGKSEADKERNRLHKLHINMASTHKTSTPEFRHSTTALLLVSTRVT